MNTISNSSEEEVNEIAKNNSNGADGVVYSNQARGMKTAMSGPSTNERIGQGRVCASVLSIACSHPFTMHVAVVTQYVLGYW